MEPIDTNEQKPTIKPELSRTKLVPSLKKPQPEMTQEGLDKKTVFKTEFNEGLHMKIDQESCSTTEKSTMTTLTSAELDLIMANFGNFTKTYQV
jgi:hypothetical protein